jgi:hypothetical protein
MWSRGLGRAARRRLPAPRPYSGSEVHLVLPVLLAPARENTTTIVGPRLVGARRTAPLPGAKSPPHRGQRRPEPDAFADHPVVTSGSGDEARLDKYVQFRCCVVYLNRVQAEAAT